MPSFRRHSRSFSIVICAFFVVLVIGLQLSRFNKPLLKLESYSQDMLLQVFGKRSKIRPELVFLAINRDSLTLDQFDPAVVEASPALKLMKQEWPWPRKVYPLIIERLVNAGAKVVALDLTFFTRHDDDDEFYAGVEKYRDHVVLASNFVKMTGENGGGTTMQLPLPGLMPDTSPIDDRVGYVNYWPDFDEVVREAYYRRSMSSAFGYAPETGEEVFNSFPSVALHKFGRDDLIPPPGPHRFRYAGPPLTFIPRSVCDIFDDYNWKNRYGDGSFFKDKIVVVGPDGNYLKDMVRTPFGQMPGPEMHLNVINAALNKDFVKQTTPAQNYFLIALAGLVSWALCYFFPAPLLRLGLLILACAGWLMAAQVIYNFCSLYILSAIPLVVLVPSGICCLAWDFFMEQKEKTRLRGKFERYVSRQVVKEIVDNPESYFNTKGGVFKPVAIFFSDLRGFTSMTEQAKDPHALVAQLNEYFDVMVAPILANNGCLDKLIGDAIMAVWGNIHSRGPAGDVRDAVTSALKMREVLPELNLRWEGEGKMPYTMGMGVNYGEVIVGDLGSQQQKNFTVIGDPVNLGSRIEGTTKEYGVDLLVGEDAASLVKDYFLMQTAGLTQVKGRKKPVELFYVIGERPAVVEPRQEEYLRVYGEGMALYIKGDFVAAGEKFKRSLELHPPDALAKVYIERCAIMANDPVPEGWNGVFVMKGK